jgi:predicted PurR-regulated permease PerM
VIRDQRASSDVREVAAPFIDFVVRLGALGLLLYLAFVLVEPFVSVLVWGVVLTVALYPVFDWMAFLLGNRRRLAAALITLLTLLIVIGPATWLALGLIESIRIIVEQLDLSGVTIPPPSGGVKEWPLIGNAIFQFWDLASTNFQAALAKIAPQLKSLGTSLLLVGADAGIGTIKFLVSIILAGILFPPAPTFAKSLKQIAVKLNASHGELFIDQAGAIIRALSRGVIGVSVLQALLAGVGLMVGGVPRASFITFAVLLFGIIQIGPSIILVPVVIWSWTVMDAASAALFTLYMVPVNLLDNFLRPIVMGQGLKTPTLVILIGVLGGTIAYGITGLFLGPIVLAVIWELMDVWIKQPEAA